MGSYVTASGLTMTLVDRIFTRIGAYDNLLKGKSTFFVEMEESKTFLTEATKNSFAIIDELGRGTSTFDGEIFFILGIAIAYAVLKYICENIKCFTMFTTHYQSLIYDF